jgi:FkbM family methyltransferase
VNPAATLYRALARVTRALPPFRGKGRLARAAHARLAGAIADDPVQEVTMRDGSRARWDLRDAAEAQAFWLGEADDAVRRALLARVAPDAVVLDVGANVGWWTIPLARALGPRGGRVVAFEPVPANRERLRWAIAANGVDRYVDLVDVALGERPGKLGMWLKSSQTGATSGTAALVTGAGPAHVTVAVHRLDDWARERALGRCDLVKLDIEGAELMMLRGAGDFLARTRPLVFGEFDDYWLGTFGASFPDVAEWAEANGYRILRWDARRLRFEPLARAEKGVQDVLLEPMGEARPPIGR